MGLRGMAVLAMLALASGAGGGFAWADTANGTTGTAGAPIGDPNEMVCKQVDLITGSRLPGPKICRKRMEWEQIQRSGNEGLQGRMNMMSPNNGAGPVYSDGDR